MNVHFQCKIFNKLLDDGIVIPIAPLWSHFQHTVFPRKYEDWIGYDQSLLRLYDCCLRLNANLPEYGYEQASSSGADAEVETFLRLNRPVFYSEGDMYQWVECQWQGGV